MGLVDGKIAFVTGAGQGLGEGVAHALAADGAAVVLADRGFVKVEKIAGDLAAAGYEALAVECDVRDRPSVDGAVDAAVAKFGKVLKTSSGHSHCFRYSGWVIRSPTSVASSFSSAVRTPTT